MGAYQHGVAIPIWGCRRRSGTSTTGEMKREMDRRWRRATIEEILACRDVAQILAELAQKPEACERS